MKSVLHVFSKEFYSFFASPAAWLFLGVFLIVSLFIFFWVETFFARNIADLKPLFQWMPILMIFLVAALTMRSWSEERRSGTLELLMTSPVTPLQLVLGKFLASLALVMLALLLTLPLPVTVSMMGPLDWGPVLGAYLASLFLAAAYIAIGLYMSARTDNPIVALILTVAVAWVFYLLGSPTLTNLFGHDVSGFMALLGSGSRFDSITRGVLDIRDLYYYFSIVGIFLTLNLFSLEKIRWAGNHHKPHHNHWGWLSVLLMVNFGLANVWLNSVGTARLDLTQGKIYSLSAATQQYLQQVNEPLLIRGYFSSKSHPLLEPLTPQIKDLLKEYQVAGGDKVRVEFVDPHKDQALEEEAAEKYGIKPVPFRMASRYEAGVVNSYFDLVISYGDQYETLSYDDLIEVKADGESDLEVLLKNPEYAITRSIRKVVSGWQAGGNVFANLQKPLTFHGFISADEQLPEQLITLRQALQTTLDELQQEAGDKLRVEFADPEAGDGQLAEKLEADFGFGPQIASLFDPQPFWFYMMLQGDNESVQVPLPAGLEGDELKKSIIAAVQRMSSGFLKTVTLVTPEAPQPMNPFMGAAGGKRYQTLEEVLEEDVRLKKSDLKDGQVPADTDLLVLLAPENLDSKQVFAIDQFLMQGGSIVLASSPFDVSIAQSLSAEKKSSGLEDWLKFQGIHIGDTMVMDQQNAALPVPVQRQVGPISVNEIQMMSYPHFPDIREAGLNQDSPIVSALGQLTLNWVSPVSVDQPENATRQITELLHSSENSWVSESTEVVPDYQRYPEFGFDSQDNQFSSQTLAVMVQGSFESYYKGKNSPLLEEENTEEATAENADDPNASNAEKDEEAEKTVVSGVIERSSDSARIIVIGSNSFASDTALELASQGLGTLYAQPLAFLQNAIDWSLDDQGLLAIRSRAQFARTLHPMARSTQIFWEYLNYGLVLLGLALVWFWHRGRQRKKQAYYQKVLAEV